MKKFLKNILLIIIIVCSMQSCLTVEKKEYTFKMVSADKGILTIKFINIMSVSGSEDELNKDFEELIQSFVEGERIEQEYPFAKLVYKKIFEENGKLCAKIQFEFDELTAVKLYRYNEIGPYMYSISHAATNEKYAQSNGNYGGEVMPVVFWENDTKKLDLITSITNPDKTSKSLLDKFKSWELTKSRKNKDL